MIDDAILSREAYLIYNNNTGFTPIQGNLMKWEGTISLPTGQNVKIYITLPEGFPHKPPVITTNSQVLTKAIYNSIKTIHRWKPHYHVYQVIWEIIQASKKGLLNVSPEQLPETQETAKTSNEQLLQKLLTQKAQLESQLQEKKQQLQVITHSRTQSPQSLPLKDVLLDSKTEVEQDLFILETQQENAEIGDLEFAKKFVELRTRLALLDMQIQKCKT